jgi:hypothetical protein
LEAVRHPLGSPSYFMEEVAAALHLPYKAVVDALNSLHNHGRVERKGRKFSATWGAAPLVQESLPPSGWNDWRPLGSGYHQ